MENSDNNDDGQASSAGYSKLDVDQLLAAMKKQTDEAMSVIQKDVLLEIRRAQANFEEYEVESPPRTPHRRPRQATPPRRGSDIRLNSPILRNRRINSRLIRLGRPIRIGNRISPPPVIQRLQ